MHFSRHFGRNPFILVVDFVRFNFHLSPKSVAIALQSCHGGTPFGFMVSLLRNNCFSFLVCNKQVGLFIYSLKNFICKDFHVKFFLWGNGGPNWQKEFISWQKEESDQWTVVSIKKKSAIAPRFSYAAVTKKNLSKDIFQGVISSRQNDVSGQKIMASFQKKHGSGPLHSFIETVYSDHSKGKR